MNSSKKNPVTVRQGNTSFTVSGELGNALALIIVISAGVALLKQLTS